MSEVITTPIFYVLGRDLPRQYVDAAEVALTLTPCAAVVISDLQDAKIAWAFAPMVLRADTDLLALQLARQWAVKTQRPLLVIGKAEFLDAVYFDGHTESVTMNVVPN